MIVISVPSLPLIHFFPYNYEWINNGYLLQETTTEAFSSETLSAGSPSVFQTA
jgi:hypothetical protein